MLSASYIVFLLKPHSRNFSKRLIKTPILCILRYRSAVLSAWYPVCERFGTVQLAGAIFEARVISELYKSCFNAGIEPPLYYWRDSQGHEVDLIIEDGEKLYPVEIKSAQTVSGSMMPGLYYWRDLDLSNTGMLICGGSDNYAGNGIQVRSRAVI